MVSRGASCTGRGIRVSRRNPVRLRCGGRYDAVAVQVVPYRAQLRGVANLNQPVVVDVVVNNRGLRSGLACVKPNERKCEQQRRNAN